MFKNINITLIILGIFGIIFVNCQKENNNHTSVDNFKLSSSAIAQDSLLPKEFTCDGASSTLPLAWNGFPENTRSFTIIMHHEVSPTDIHCYWIIYNIPDSVQSLPKNSTGIGTLGKNSLNDRLTYAPPCSQGPGMKKYTYTIYALSGKVNVNVEPGMVDMVTILKAVERITLSSSIMNVYYSREP